MSIALRFEVIAVLDGDLTDTAEAEDLAGAELAARTLVSDGNDSATILHGTQQLGGCVRQADGSAREWTILTASIRRRLA